MLKDNINSLVFFFFLSEFLQSSLLPSKDVPFTNWYKMYRFEEATMLAPVLNMKTLTCRMLRAKVNPQITDDHLEA